MSNKFPKTPPWVAALFDELWAALPGERRRMFGSLCTFIGGNLASGTFGQSFFLRLADDDRATLLALDGAGYFAPIAGRPMSKYVLVPPAMLDDEPELRGWLRKCAEHVGSLPQKAPKKSKKKK